jgi:hypothetical protein
LSCEFFNTCFQYLSIHKSSTYCTISLCLSLIVSVLRFNHSLCCLVFWACLTVDLPFTRLTCQLLCICVLFICIVLILYVQTGFQNETQNYFVFRCFIPIFLYSLMFLHLLLCLCFVLSQFSIQICKIVIPLSIF